MVIGYNSLDSRVAEDVVFGLANQARPKTAPPDQKRLKTLDIRYKLCEIMLRLGCM
jgi:hypothetical protein